MGDNLKVNKDEKYLLTIVHRVVDWLGFEIIKDKGDIEDTASMGKVTEEEISDFIMTNLLNVKR